MVDRGGFFRFFSDYSRQYLNTLSVAVTDFTFQMLQLTLIMNKKASLVADATCFGNVNFVDG